MKVNLTSKDNQAIYDLKTLSSIEFKEKYDLTEAQYNEAITNFQAGVPIPNWQPKVDNLPVPGESVDEEPVLVEEPRPGANYTAECFGDNVLVSRVEKDHSSALIIPDSAKTKMNTGYIKSVGPDVKGMEPGMLVTFDEFASHGKEIDLIDEQGIIRKYLNLKMYDVQLKLIRTGEYNGNTRRD